MLHGMINEQGYCHGVRDDIFMFSSKSLVSGALILEITFIADYQAHVQML